MYPSPLEELGRRDGGICSWRELSVMNRFRNVWGSPHITSKVENPSWQIPLLQGAIQGPGSFHQEPPPQSPQASLSSVSSRWKEGGEGESATNRPLEAMTYAEHASRLLSAGNQSLTATDCQGAWVMWLSGCSAKRKGFLVKS